MVRVTRSEDYLEHHGILGQKWGESNGPPYPLDEKIHDAVVSGKNAAKKVASQAKNAVNSAKRTVTRAYKTAAEKARESIASAKAAAAEEKAKKEKEQLEMATMLAQSIANFTKTLMNAEDDYNLYIKENNITNAAAKKIIYDKLCSDAEKDLRRNEEMWKKNYGDFKYTTTKKDGKVYIGVLDSNNKLYKTVSSK